MLALKLKLLYCLFVADDHNRVKLTKVPGEIGSDYINASYIDVSLFYIILTIIFLLSSSLTGLQS